MDEQAEQTKSKRGFASMTPEQQREIASRGGRAAHEKGTAHTFTSEEASAAGKKGGAKCASIPGRMSEIGRIGGLKRGKKLREKTKP